MATSPSFPVRHCDACGRGHYVAVPFCPFCGSGQDVRQPARTGPPPAPPASRPDPAPAAYVSPPAPPLAEPKPHRPRPAARPLPARIPPGRTAARARRRIRHIVLTVLIVGALTCPVPQWRDGSPPHVLARLRIGAAWTSVAQAALHSAPALRLSGDGAFSLRIDGERVVRVAPGEGITVGTALLRSLELRAGRPTIVTLTPQPE